MVAFGGGAEKLSTTTGGGAAIGTKKKKPLNIFIRSIQKELKNGPPKAWAGCIAALIASAATIAIAVLDNLFVLVFAIVFYLVTCAGAPRRVCVCVCAFCPMAFAPHAPQKHDAS